MVQRLEADFKVTLQQQNSLEQWAVWLKGVVTQVLKPYEGKPTYVKAARQFLLKWSFYRFTLNNIITITNIRNNWRKTVEFFIFFWFITAQW